MLNSSFLFRWNFKKDLSKSSNMPSIYISDHVRAVQYLHRAVISQNYLMVKEQLRAFVENLWDAYQYQDQFVWVEFSNYHPKWKGQLDASISFADLKKEDCQMVIAKEYGFKDWYAVEQCELAIDHVFSSALNLLLTGKKDALAQLLDEFPDLVHQRSHYAHQATLLHYVGSNGVEIWRQVVPDNLVEITQLLLARGADPLAEANIYGETTTASLIASSDHPFQAGIQKDLLELFIEST